MVLKLKKKKKEVNFWLHPLLSNSGLCSIQTVCDRRALWDINDSRCDLNKHCFPVFLNPLRLPFCLYEFHVFAEKKKNPICDTFHGSYANRLNDYFAMYSP